MKETKITLFANFFIDNKERFRRLKFSFLSIKNINFSEWVINVRGKYKYQVSNFLKKNIKKKKVTITFYEDERGWNFDSSKLLSSLKSKYVFPWLEDQICIIDSKTFQLLINNLDRKNIDIINYSLFLNGNNLKSFGPIKKKVNKYFYYLNYSSIKHKARLYYVKKNNIFCHIFIISYPSIIKKKLFCKIIKTNDPFIKRWPKNTPFNFEKGPKDYHWLPLKYAIPRFEIFSSIDDNGGVKGTSLIEKGKYKVFSKKRITYANNITFNYKKTFIINIREILNRFYAFLFFKN